MPARNLTALLLPPCLLLASAAACGSSSSAGSEPPALTREQAQEVIARYSRDAPRSLASAETDPQLAMDAAALKMRRVTKRRAPSRTFSHTALYVPRMAGYPRWFAADAISGQGKETLRHALLFTQAKAGAPWLLAADPLPTDASLGRVALDPDGYASPVDPGLKGLAITPADLPRAHSALFNGGPKAPGASALGPGPKTDQAYRALVQGEAALKGQGIGLVSRFSPAPGPVFALRTRDRGALVWYAVKQNEAYTTTERGKLAVTGDLVGLAPARSARTRVDTTVLVQYLAAVPPKGRATVTGMYRKAVAAKGS
ncbi:MULTISPECIES: hypothetical protein [Actinomadura]|uniref:DUF8094 domain-containing protein n=1 Tax=Actinomadura yumaensis TaxID=111807 RepID=A0ABW2CU55_9ACTN|nr:hypothetical protein [Actinomadura sp. J1-007]MWK36203.1 hypothetical protein [Actinomadura sp. J1-007]